MDPLKVLMNLVTAVIVNSAFEQASQDREAQQVYEQRRKEKLVGDLVRTFQKLAHVENQAQVVFVLVLATMTWSRVVISVVAQFLLQSPAMADAADF
ncbi:hypothetical protein AK812_SmicGene11287 [Symbiodinium microadriaticum]|uniref:Uncharacterized protein n=1 Tax=Symbiodinium microadriaticum TaxID=2951 RepID=A0A1Q9EDL4_SYMMI|nr:hypothetical protein AK812_SmicGene11287 [Symbiodinium microadriaticum]